jgi:hypothetical protein
MDTAQLKLWRHELSEATNNPHQVLRARKGLTAEIVKMWCVAQAVERGYSVLSPWTNKKRLPLLRQDGITILDRLLGGEETLAIIEEACARIGASHGGNVDWKKWVRDMRAYAHLLYAEAFASAPGAVLSVDGILPTPPEGYEFAVIKGSFRHENGAYRRHNLPVIFPSRPAPDPQGYYRGECHVRTHYNSASIERSSEEWCVYGQDGRWCLMTSHHVDQMLSSVPDEPIPVDVESAGAQQYRLSDAWNTLDADQPADAVAETINAYVTTRRGEYRAQRRAEGEIDTWW